MATLIVAGPISTGGLIALFIDGLGLRIDAFGTISMPGQSGGSEDVIN